MAASPLLGLTLQLPGSNINLWGQILNDEVFTLLEQAIAGVQPIALTGNLTLSSTNAITNQARKAVLVLTAGSGLAAAPTITVPNKQKLWLVVNNTGFAVTFNCSGAPATLPIGRTGFIICDGVDLIKFDPVTDALAGVTGTAAAAAASAAAAAGSATAASTSASNAGSSASSSAGFASASAGYRDQAQGFANAAGNSATASAASAAGVNLPAVTGADAGKALVVNPGGTGYIPTLVVTPAGGTFTGRVNLTQSDLGTVTAGTAAINASTSNVYRLAQTGNITMAISGITAGNEVKVIHVWNSGTLAFTGVANWDIGTKDAGTLFTQTTIGKTALVAGAVYEYVFSMVEGTVTGRVGRSK